MPLTEKTDEEKEQLVKSLRDDTGVDEESFTDTNLLQFLMARNWDVKRASKQLKETKAWREKHEIDYFPCATKYNKLPLLLAVRGYDSIPDDNLGTRPGVSQTVLKIANTMGGDCFHKVDRLGHPILIDRTGYHQAKDISHAVTIDQMARYQVSCNEFLNRVIMPECSQKAGKPIHSELIIFDGSNMGMWQFHMSAFRYLKSVVNIVQKNYPETMYRILMVNAPKAVVTMWKVVRPWLEAGTAEKVIIAGKDESLKTLLDHVAPENLPDFLGGTCTCSHMPGGCVPSPFVGNIPKYEITSENEDVVSPYNSDIVERAKADPAFRMPVE